MLMISEEGRPYIAGQIKRGVDGDTGEKYLMQTGVGGGGGGGRGASFFKFSLMRHCC